ncbi:hypothetical protein [Streptomyces chattanoogensis]|uniref:hypothetical protein n=1 Tax=Streptomyces chattanoogensis TaxID=66876 RepID=UPI003682E322
MPPRPTTRLGLAAVLRAALSLLVLASVLVGLPVVLTVATPLLWANGHDELAHLLTRPDPGGDAFVLVLLAVAWLAWGHFTTCVLVEALAQARGRIARPLRGFGVSQRAAATLISSIVVLMPTGTALASPVGAQTASAHPTPGPATATSSKPTHAADAAAPDITPSGHHSHNSRSADDQRTYTVREVRPAESLWSIAARELGDGELWVQIAAANEGRTMTDGTRFHADGFLQPGWTLRLPAQQTAHHASPGAPPPSVTVKTGQTLSQIAEEQLGNADRYPAIFEKNRGQMQPGGRHFTDPDLIFTGQRLELPAPAAGGGRSAAPPRAPKTGSDKPHTPHAPRPPRDHAHPPTGPRTTPSPDTAHPNSPHTPQQQHDADAAPSAPRTSARPSARTTEPAPHSPAASSPPAREAATTTADSFDLQHLAGVGALLAASAAGALGLKRILQQRRRRRGETIAMPEEPSGLEQALTAVAEPGSVRLLDTALRTLHHHVLTSDGGLPQLRGAKVTGRSVELLPEDGPQDPIAPFASGAEGWWSLPEGAELLAPDEAQHVAAPWPGLVTIGNSPDGDLMLLNLPHTRTVLLEGTDADVRTVARAIAMEAATCVWNDRTEILTVGLGDELSTLLPQGRVRAVPHLRAAARDLGELLLEHHQADPTDPKPLPWLLICAAEATQEDAWDLADALAAARSLPVALVLPAACAAACFPHAETLDAGSTAAQACTALSAPVVLQRVTDEDYAQFAEDLRIADEPAHPAQGPWRNVPDADVDSDDGTALEPMQQAAPFASLVASAGPASIHLVPRPATSEESTESAAGSTATATPDASRGVISLFKEEPSKLDPASMPHEDPDAPEIQVLGTVSVTGVEPSGHGPKLASLAALVYFRPGRDADALREAMAPNSPWSKGTLQARTSELRSRLGAAADGELYLPRDRTAGYRFSPAVRCDWKRFQHHAEHGLSLGPKRGIDDLEQALGLVRGRPFSGGDHAWAAPLLQEMLARIVDVAHTVATWRRTAVKDLEAARRAITIGLDVDETAEVLYQDWMRVEEACGNRAGVHRAIQVLQDVNHRLDVSLAPETEEIIQEILKNEAARA